MIGYQLVRFTPLSTAMGFRTHGYRRHDEEYNQQLEAFMHSLDSGGSWFRHCCSDEYSARSLYANK